MKRKAHAVFVAASALVARVAFVLWAFRRFPPSEDGAYYDRLAHRLADGQGYTWLWPDGAVTYADHYPVGYPALLALVYRAFGDSVLFAMLLNAVLGALAALAIYLVASRYASPRAALFAGLAVAIHPALVPYTAAIMTEAVSASWMAISLFAAVAARARPRARLLWRIVSGAMVGIAVLIRPQWLVMAPMVGLLSVDVSAHWRRRIAGAVWVSAIAVACCLPWTARNCVRMQRCALVSMNAGWNLLIGAESDTGAWAPMQTPESCRTVWAEAAKDECFEKAAWREIRESPWRWAEKMPRKLAVTFDYFGAAPWYLHAANPAVFPERAKVLLGSVETIVSRLLLIAALVRITMTDPRRLGKIACIVAIGFAATEHAWVAYVIFSATVLSLRRDALWSSPLWTFSAFAIVATAATHAVFFGAGRYGLVVIPFVSTLAFVPLAVPELARSGGKEHDQNVGAAQAIAGFGIEGDPKGSLADAHEREESPSSRECDAG